MASNLVRVPNFTSLADDLQRAINGFLSYCKSKHLSDRTTEYYSYRLKALSKYLADKEKPSAPISLTAQTVREFITAESDSKSASTANHDYITLSAFFNYLVGDGFIESSPMEHVDRPKRRKTVIDTFSMKQVDDILTTCGRDFAGVRDKAIVMMLVDCGLRASEMCGITLNDIDWTDCTVLVLGKGDKERVVPFGQATRQALTAYNARRAGVETDTYFVSTLGAQIDRHRLREIIGQRCELAKITGVRCSPHTFRHTMAVQYLRNGGDVFSLQKLLGHSSLDMTRKYAELSQTDVQDKHRLYSPADRLEAAKQTKGRKRLK
ncbi:MAG: tyrosine-type recombinase/integrase [Armatimonadota bacterium]|nr:tyrosine-type recombinase/integrase [bacterium]